MIWLAVAAVGGVASVARLLVTRAVGARTFPYGTLAVNLTGAFVLGVLAGAAVGETAARLAGTAAVGSYTTFSTWMLESRELQEQGRGRAAALNVALSLLLGLGAAALGHALGGAV